MMMKLYQMSSWGPDGQDDVVLFVTARTVKMAGTLADENLKGRADLRCSGKANAAFLLAEVTTNKQQVISGPYRGLAVSHFIVDFWVREPWHKKWVKREIKEKPQQHGTP